jgi:indole-3-glycerol phosphate synthase
MDLLTAFFGLLLSPLALLGFGLSLVVLFYFVIAIYTALTSPAVLDVVVSDIKAIRERDPAAEGWIACAFYPGWWALVIHRLIAHPLYEMNLRTFARLANFWARFVTGADIHPGAQLGQGIFIDHAHGVVIGETAVVGDNVTMLHQVTLGGTGKECGKRHPTIEEGVLLGVGSKVLGNIVIGRNSKVGAGSVVVHAVPPDSTVVGIPGRVVASGGQRVPSQLLDQTSLPDPLVEKMLELQEELRTFKQKLKNGKSAADTGEMPKTDDILAKIVRDKHDEVAATKARVSLDQLRAMPTRRMETRNFYKALAAPGLSLIAEIKKASPSGGLLREQFDPSEIARTYSGVSASALSVLTDEKYFQGHIDFLAQARQATTLPILRKEFIVDEYQIVEAGRYGADAVLLIVACLTPSKLRDFREAAEGEGLDVLVEVHDEQELEIALKSGARIVGINNRNLKTLETDLETTFRLAKSIPPETRKNILLVSESGIKNLDDTRRLIEAGIDAVLIGETFMRSPDIAEKVREVMGGYDYAI